MKAQKMEKTNFRPTSRPYYKKLTKGIKFKMIFFERENPCQNYIKKLKGCSASFSHTNFLKK